MSLTASARTLTLLASLALSMSACGLEPSPEDDGSITGDATVDSDGERPESSLDKPTDNIGDSSDGTDGTSDDDTGSDDGSETSDDNADDTDSSSGGDDQSSGGDDNSGEDSGGDTDTGDEATDSDTDNEDETTEGGEGACIDDAFAGNDTETTAWTLTPGTYNNLVACSDAPDFYAVTVAEGTTLTATATFADTEGDIDLALLDAAGTTLDSSLSTSDNESVGPVTVTSSGTYFVRVTLYADSGSSPGNAYELEVAVGPSTGAVGDDDDAASSDDDDDADDDDSNDDASSDDDSGDDDSGDDDDVNGDDDDASGADDDASGDSDATGDDGASPALPCASDEYQVDLYDSHGDGWGANALFAYDANNNLLDIHTLIGGFAGSVCIMTPDCLTLTYDDSGAWDGENSYEVFDPTGSSLGFQAGAGAGYYTAGPADFTNCTSDSTGSDSGDSSDSSDSTQNDDDGDTSDDATSPDICVDDALESNDTATTAWTVVPGSYAGLVACDDNDDYYALDLNDGDSLTVSVLFGDDEGDLDLVVLDPTGDLLGASLSIDDDESVGPVTVDTTGTYLVIVNTFADNGVVPGNGYTMSIVVNSPAGSDDGASTDAGDEGTCSSVAGVTCAVPMSSNTNYSFASSLIDGYSCSSWDATGPEMVFSFVAQTSGDVTASLSNLPSGQDLDIYVMEDVAGSCLADECIAYGNTAATFSTVAGETYYISVDGYFGASGNFTLELSCPSSSSDDDVSTGDDSDDNDDSSNSSVDQPGSCSPRADLPCGAAVTSDTSASSATNLIDGYSCSSWDASGPEAVYSYTAQSTGDVTVSLTSIQSGQDLDIYVMQDLGGSCLADECISYGNTSATFAAVAGDTYYLSVDGYQGAAGDFTLEVTCGSTATTGGTSDSDTGSTSSDDSDGDSSTDNGDIDQSTPSLPFVGKTHCLDWDTVTISDPSQMNGYLSDAGVDLNDFPLLLSTTSMDPVTGELSVLGGTAQTGTCNQDLSQPTIDFTAAQPGIYNGGLFEVGPVDMPIILGAETYQLYDVVIDGEFSPDGTTITDATLTAELDISNMDLPWGACLFALNCHACPTGNNDCVTFLAEGAVLNDNGQGPMVYVP